MMENKKQLLIKALKQERLRFSNRGQSTLEHDIAIDYLETGTTNENPDEFELLDSVMNDFDYVCSDYLN